MARLLPMGFYVTTTEPIDTRLVLTKEQMRAIKKGAMPEQYFALCPDDGKMYKYNKSNTIDSDTGRFRLLQSDYNEETIEELIKQYVQDKDISFSNATWGSLGK